MRVAIDAQLTVGTATGIGEYVRGLTDGLRAEGAEVIPLRWSGCDPWRFDRRVLWDQVVLPIRSGFARAELLHCASGTMPLVCGLPMVVTVHDVAWLRAQAHARPYARAYFGEFSVARYRRARRILVDSCFSRDELLGLAEVDSQRVDVIYPGVASDIMRVVRRPAEQPLILAVGTVEKRKNLAVVIRALAGIKDAYLVAVGPFTPYREECERLAMECGVGDRVVFRGYVSREELLGFYAQARVAVVPSLYEGFGYGVAQAMCAGVPFIAGNVASLPEIAADAGTLLDPLDVEAWERELSRVIVDHESHERRAASARAASAERFSWSAAAVKTLQAYDRALSRS